MLLVFRAVIAPAFALVALAAVVSVASAGARPPACSVTNVRFHRHFTSLQAATDAAQPNDALTVMGNCVGNTIVNMGLTIRGATGNGYPGPPTLVGGDGGSVLVLEGGYNGDAPPSFAVAINNLTITHGATSGDGGGIASEGVALTVTNSTVTENTAGLGGGIVVRGGTVVLNDTAVRGNSAYRGGGIFVYTATVTLNNSSVTGNVATLRGGGIELLDPINGDGYPPGSVNLYDSTVADNQPDDCVGPFVC
jgi:hypothetical protein